LALLLPYHPTRWQRTAQRLLAARYVSAIIAPIANSLDAPFIRLSHGRMSLTSILTGLPVVTLTTLGAKSGQPRRVLLVAIPLDNDGGQSIILIASNFGRSHHPAWYYNLQADPHATLSTGDFTGEYLAHEATGEERDYAWQQAAILYGGYNTYRQRASHRTIGVFVLTPLPAG
jgi:F420H(2)-dependent quinone reductase